jgi:glutathione synthase/RimK-type ligase-like ATP-grasp enzyme
MQKVLILVSWQSEEAAEQRYKARALAHQEVTVRRLDSFFASWNGEELEFTDARAEIRLEDFDVVHFAGWQPQPEMAYVAAQILRKKNIPFVGKTLLDIYPGTKVGEMVRLVLAGAPYPKSFFTTNSSQLTTLWEWAHHRHGLEFPVIVKAIAASKGEENFLIHSAEELQALRLDAAHRYIMQECIPNDGDYRVLVLGGEVRLVIKRSRQNNDTHLNNTAQGAAAVVVSGGDVPAGLKDTSLAAALALGRQDIAGVDVLIDSGSGKQYVLEVNKTPHMSIGAQNIIEQKLTALFSYLDQIATKGATRSH